MKFALRDDDLNYFFHPKEIEHNYKEIWDICPISMSVVPFIKGNWKENVIKMENHGPGEMSPKLLEDIINDKKVYPIGNNKSLINFIKDKIEEKKIYLTLHGIYHRNEDPIIPKFDNNFGIGAEFYTTRDLTNKVKKAINYLEDLFQQKIEVFTPPQNSLSNKGLDALVNNNLFVCTDLPDLRRLETIFTLGIINYLKYGIHKVNNRGFVYPHTIINGRLKIVDHQRLQPGTDIMKIYEGFERAHKNDGVFVLSTHSHGFSYKMNNSDKRMGQVLKEFVHYVSNKRNVEFVSLNQLFYN